MALAVCFVLVLMVWFAFGQSLAFDFVNYDDNQYVYENSHISNGLTQEGARRIVTHPHSSNWHPLTSLSHMLDCQLYGLTPAGHHLTNLLLHLATVLLLFSTLRKMTGSLWRSAIVAALFAIHPLRVESVVWISERKDVLSGLFFMLTLSAYVRYVRRPFSVRRYLAVCGMFLLGLLSKSMLVTLPFVLLLLDFWPLRRRPQTSAWRLVSEKLPLLILSALFCGITLWAQQDAVAPTDSYSFLWRINNALFSYVIYLRQFICPAGLAVPYPAHGQVRPLWELACAILLLGGLTLAAVWQIRRRPFLLTGWLWYLGMLIPVIGILQVGGQAHADRYTYLPQIGIGIAVVWLVGEWATSRPRRGIVSAIAVAILCGLSVGARNQAGYWRDGKTLWTRALACTENNFVAHSNLGTMLFAEGNTSAAIDHFEQSLQIEYGQAAVHNNLAVAYAEQGRYTEAVQSAQRALTLAEGRLEPAIIESIRERLKKIKTLAPTDPSF